MKFSNGDGAMPALLVAAIDDTVELGSVEADAANYGPSSSRLLTFSDARGGPVLEVAVPEEAWPSFVRLVNGHYGEVRLEKGPPVRLVE